jgi:predicted negative regulator of RcsB-dependent stress response
MATNLDLQEQEQLDQLKAFWSQYGNLITWTLTLALAGFAAFNGWSWWQREQGSKASALYDELDRAAQAGDITRTVRAFTDLRERFGRTLQSQQGALLAAKVQADKGQAEAALATLQWAVDNAAEDEYRVIARLRIAGVLMDKRSFDKALEQLDAAAKADVHEFDALIADRRGDVLLAMGRKAEAVLAYQGAYKAMDEKIEYRRLLDAKLTALGAAPESAASAANK